MPSSASPIRPADSSPRHDRWILPAIASWLAVYVGWMVTSVWKFTTDDAYISLRYAHNLATGAGLVWNPSDGPLEGYSNFSFVLLGALAETIGVDPVVALKGAGLLGLVATLACLYGISRMWLGPLGSLLAPMGLVAYYGTIFWATSGLETAVFQALVAASCLAFLRGSFEPHTLAYRPRTNGPLLIVASVLLFLATLTRPEAPLFAAVFAGVLVWTGFRQPRLRRRLFVDALRLFLPFGILLLLYWLWKWSYFGSLLPNSFACKLVESGRPTKLTRELLEIASVPLILTLGSRTSLRGPAWILIAPTLIYLYLLYGADPIIAHFNRHGLTAFGLLLVAAAIGLIGFVSARSGLAPARVEKGAALLLALGLLAFGLRHDGRFADHAHRYGARMDARERVGEWLRQTGGPDASFVVGDAGVISWIANGSNSIDAFCLNNPAMAREAGGRDPLRFARRVLEEIRPEFIVMASTDPNHLEARAGYGIFPAIVEHERFADYTLDKIEPSLPDDGFHYFVYRRKADRPRTLTTGR